MISILEQRLKERIEFPVKIEKGICIGEYIKPQPKDLFEYGRVPAPFEIGETRVMPHKRTHATMYDGEEIRKAFWEENKFIVEELSEQMAYCGFENHRSPVYKPYKYYTAGPFTQCDNPIIEKIILRGRKMYLGIINNKLVSYSVSYDKTGKKQFRLHDLKIIEEEQNNRQYLKQIATEKLNKLIEDDKIIDPTFYDNPNKIGLYETKLFYLDNDLNNELQAA